MADYPTVPLFSGPTRLGTLDVAAPTTVGHVLTVTDTSPLAVAWQAGGGGGGGGAVTSVNGQTGTVVLDADDVGALEAADIGVSVQGYDALLASIAGLSMVADRYIYGTNTDAVALGTITSFARTILDDADAAAVRATIGAGTGSGDVTAAANFATDNVILRADGTGKGAQSSGVTLSDGDLLSGVEGLALDQRAASPGSGYLWTSDGTAYTAGTLVWSDAAQVLGELGLGDPGSEQASILLNGSTYTAPFKVNAFGTSRAGAVLHQHSNTVEPDLVFARSRGTTATHSQVTDTTILGRLIWAGWIDGTTGYARGAEVRAVIDGTPSASSAPTRLDFATTPSGSLTPTDRWCILPGGTLRPAADNSYQLGNTSFALTEGWARQWMVLEQASVTAPGGGWAGRSGFWAKNDAPTSPMFTDDGGTDRRLIHRDDAATTSAAGVVQLAGATSYASGRVIEASDWRSLYSIATPGFGARLANPTTTPSRIGNLSNADITGTYTGAGDTTLGLHYTCTLTTASARGWGSGGTFRTVDHMRIFHLWQWFKLSSVSTMRVGFGLATSMATLATSTTTTATIRLVIDAGTITGRCADGTTESATATFSSSLSNATWYVAEVQYDGTTATFTIRNGTTLAVIESKTHTSNIPSGSTNSAWGMSAIATSGTPVLSDGRSLIALV
jgi:hypothetical protein